jgi:hypothetical protein
MNCFILSPSVVVFALRRLTTTAATEQMVDHRAEELGRNSPICKNYSQVGFFTQFLTG